MCEQQASVYEYMSILFAQRHNAEPTECVAYAMRTVEPRSQLEVPSVFATVVEQLCEPFKHSFVSTT